MDIGKGQGDRDSDVEFVEHRCGAFGERFAAADFIEAVEKSFVAEPFVYGAVEVVQDVATVGHDNVVARADGLLHRMGDHVCGELVMASANAVSEDCRSHPGEWHRLVSISAGKGPEKGGSKTRPTSER